MLFWFYWWLNMLSSVYGYLVLGSFDNIEDSQNKVSTALPMSLLQNLEQTLMYVKTCSKKYLYVWTIVKIKCWFLMVKLCSHWCSSLDSWWLSLISITSPNAHLTSLTSHHTFPITLLQHDTPSDTTGYQKKHFLY